MTTLARLFGAVALVLAAGACGESADSASFGPGDESATSTTTIPDAGDDDGARDGEDDTTVTSGPPATAPVSDEPIVDYLVTEPIAVAESADFGSGLEAVVVRIDDVELDARGVGETAGPGVAVVVELTNRSDEPIAIGGVVVNATVRDDVPASPNFSPPHEPFEGDLAPGESATATYLFRIDDGERPSLVVDLHHDGSPNVILVEAGA